MPVPDQIGRFVVAERIGGGAFASVWRAHDEALDASVAIKVLAENWLDAMDVRRRFTDEAKLLRRAESDRVVRVHDLGELDDGRPYLVMTYADRGTLDDRLKAGPLPWRDAVAVAVEIALAVQRLHASGVLHRDIKPSNVLFRSGPDGREQVMLGDLGLGKLLSEASLLTLAGGTPAFMAPEQARPGTPLSVRTDLYGLGALLYVALTGRNPHDSASAAEVAGRSESRPPSALVTAIPSDVDKVVLRALSPDPEDRQPDAAALVAELRQVAAGAPVPRPPRKRRRRLPVLISAALLLVAAAGVVYWWLPPSPTADVGDESGLIGFSVPREWAKQSADSTWDPATLGAAGPPQPAVLVAKSVAGFPDPDDTRQGVFAGVLPPGTALSTTDFDERVTRDHCAPATVQPVEVEGLLTLRTQLCRAVVVQDALMSEAGRLVWVQVKQPSNEVTQTDEVLASLTITP
ncbi:serine/threonine-protein kinase [Saccharopolyspora shandongensis]|uniref:serine/threonine-protein kinase n=1 Tax=Saccharopolyspora shandongensis TaxID=418495 RepID=UPI0033C95B92